MLIVNADDWGRSELETQAAFECYRGRRITSVTAMVFMENSERAAELANRAGIDVGLHLNLNQEFSGRKPSAEVIESHDRVRRFLGRGKYALLVYNPLLKADFRRVYVAQAEEFERLYGKSPSHIDGHQHMHLCANMLFDRIIPEGTKLRRNFSFWPGEKSYLNRLYRQRVDAQLACRYRLTQYFFGLSECLRNGRLECVARLAKGSTVELMTHPVIAEEHSFLTSEAYAKFRTDVQVGSYEML
jgi:chitin disaccharide deacetylase